MPVARASLGCKSGTNLPKSRRAPKLGSRARRALQEQQVAEPGRLFGEEVGAEGVPVCPPAPFPRSRC